MAVDQPERSSSFLALAANFYRKTLKRIPLLHRIAHRLSIHLLFPLLELVTGFRTMPDDPFWFRLELLTGRHEPETTARLRASLKPGMTMLDIGAHVGYYTRMASGLIGEQGRVVAFEPHPRNHAFLTRNTANRPNVTILQVALAEQEGTAELHDYLMMSASGSLHYDETLRQVQLSQKRSDVDFAPRLGKDFQPRTYTVRTAPVDTLLADLHIERVDVIKMDIEGAELGALRGMRQTIQRSPRLLLVMEYNPLGLQAFGNQPEAALQEVLELGFDRMAVIEPDGSLTDYTTNPAGIVTLTAGLTQHMGVVNMLFTRGT